MEHLDQSHRVSQLLPLHNKISSNQPLSPFSRPGPYPRTFIIPGRDIVLALLLGMEIDGRFLNGLLAVSEAVVDEELECFDENTSLFSTPQPSGGYAKSFKYSLGDGLGISIINVRDQDMTVGNLRDVLWGLRIYLIDEQRNRECSFTFSIGAGATKAIGTIAREKPAALKSEG